MFPAVSLLTVLPVLFVGLVAESFAALLVGGFFLGLGGTTLAIGVPLVNAWYPPARRGTALGFFGIGIYDVVGDYSLGLGLLAAVCVGTALFTRGPVRRSALPT